MFTLGWRLKSNLNLIDLKIKVSMDFDVNIFRAPAHPGFSFDYLKLLNLIIRTINQSTDGYNFYYIENG